MMLWNYETKRSPGERKTANDNKHVDDTYANYDSNEP